ncbi:MAG TPA: CHRD domain-containing protein, partial [Thermoanaerobaculaceae bacterium]|nr:CHRD domain-containing protein [Thermoanaerobaculaceae bacterium]
MRKALTLALLLGLVAEMSGAASFRATLRGDRETPSAGDPNGWGFAAAILDGGTLRYYLLTHGIAAPSVASIHAGRPGKSGSAVVTLATSFGTVGSDTFASAGSVPVEAGLAQALAADPTAYYFTVDNADFPSGALRGQLAGDGGGGPTRVAELIGRREVPPGDPDGAGFAAATVIGDTVHCFFWGKGIGSPTAAHIQRGAPGVAGPVVVDCQPAFADGMGVGSATVDSSLASELLTNPAMFYFNLHTAEFAGGALRGQLADAETSVFFPVVSGTSGVGGTLWRTDIRILNPGDMEAMVRGELYPANSTGLQSPSKSVIISVAPG